MINQRKSSFSLATRELLSKLHSWGRLLHLKNSGGLEKPHSIITAIPSPNHQGKRPKITLKNTSKITKT